MTIKDTGCVWIGIGIDIAPSDSIFSQLTQLNSQLNQEFASPYNLELIPPHINLYDLDIPKDNLDKVDEALKEIAQKFQGFSLKLSNVSFFKHGSIYVQCELSQELKALEKDVVEKVAVFKGNCRTEDYWQPWREYNEQQKRYRDQYGNPHVLDSFSPHVTVGFAKGDQEKLKSVTQRLKATFSPIALIVKQINMAIQDSDGKTVERRKYPFS